MTFNFTNNNALTLKTKTMKKRRRSCSNVCLLILGILLITLSLTLFLYFDKIYDYLIQSVMTFNKDSEPFRVWRKNDPPLDMDIYLFNWTNADQVRNKSVKPHFQEVGPYRFKEVKEKINITWHDDNHTISYRHRKYYHFDPEHSVRNLSDVITTINIVPLTIAYQARNFGYFGKRTASMALSALSSLTVTKTAGEILFDGYKETILGVLSSLPLVGVKDKFGLFYGKNNTYGEDGNYTMWTKNDENFGKLMSWNGKKESNFFSGKCNAVRGSAGEFHPINRQKDYIELFSAELCKTARLEFEKVVDIKGVKGYKYTGKDLFDNGTLRPDNKCFCASNDECIPSGVFNVSSCRQDSPTFLSMPHFYNADPYYINAIEGVTPQDKHEFFITLEPKSGIAIDIGAKMQLNMLLQPIEDIALYENVPRIFIPVFYFDQQILVTDELASSLRLVQNLPDISNIAILILCILGFLSLLWVGINIFCCIREEKNDSKPTNTYEIQPLKHGDS